MNNEDGQPTDDITTRIQNLEHDLHNSSSSKELKKHREDFENLTTLFTTSNDSFTELTNYLTTTSSDRALNTSPLNDIHTYNVKQPLN